MELIGTTTSPFVRRVRVACVELGVPYTLTHSNLPEGDARLREVSPLWKVPVAIWDGQVILDSHAILHELTRRHGGPFGRTDSVRDSNLQHAVDGALDSAINVFYLRREGVTLEAVPYAQKQLGRVRAALAYVAAQLAGDRFGERDFGLAELSLYTALDWMIFRDAFPVADFPQLTAFVNAHAARPSLAATKPHA